MNLSQGPSPGDDVLARAEQALRHVPVPPGPPEGTITRTLSALAAPPAVQPALWPIHRRRWSGLLQVAAVLVVVFGSVLGLGEVFRTGSQLAFARVAEHLRDAQTLAYRMTIQSPETKQPMTVQVFQKEPDWMRMEMPGGVVSVARREKNGMRVLALQPQTKTAILVTARIDDKNLSGPMKTVNFIEKFRALANKAGRPAGTKKLGGMTVHGFRVQEGEVEWLVWADPMTQLPVEVEVKMPGNSRNVLSEFRYNPRLDDSLFSLDVPKDYKLLPVEVEYLAPEEQLVRLLRFYAEKSNGSFPKRLDRSLFQELDDRQGQKRGKANSPEELRLLMNLVGGMVFVAALKTDHGYKPEGAKLGEVQKALFWYRPEGSTKYRMLFADLHWADLTSDQLPEKPRP